LLRCLALGSTGAMRLAVHCNLQPVDHLHDAGHMPDERVKELTLVKRTGAASERDDAAIDGDRPVAAGGQMALLQGQDDAALQIERAWIARAIDENGGGHGGVLSAGPASEVRTVSGEDR
jgi:hypothetical protein